MHQVLYGNHYRDQIQKYIIDIIRMIQFGNVSRSNHGGVLPSKDFRLLPVASVSSSIPIFDVHRFLIYSSFASLLTRIEEVPPTFPCHLPCASFQVKFRDVTLKRPCFIIPSL